MAVSRKPASKKPSIAKTSAPSQEKLQELVGRLVTDETFRGKFLANPKETASGLGVPLSDKQVEYPEFNEA